MHKKILTLIATAACLTLFLASAGFATVNQTIGKPDVAFSASDQADCRACHGAYLADLHHIAAQGDPCSDCHTYTIDPGTGFITIEVENDCVVCHTSAPHHTTPEALGRDCKSCHGDIVDNFGDGHLMPGYDPSLVTPEPKEMECEVTEDSCGDSSYCTTDVCEDTRVECSIVGPAGTSPECDPTEACISEGEACVQSATEEQGGCNYCHNEDGADILDNETLHHGTGFGPPDSASGPQCFWCHQDDGVNDPPVPPVDELDIRTCEGCHGYESLHNIAVDTATNPGTLEVGGEEAGYSHVGNNDDCLGCHGFTVSSLPPSGGPVIPNISGSDATVIMNGSDTAITLTGAAFTNIVEFYGMEIPYSSEILLTAADGTATTLTPDAITQDSLTVTIPGTTAPGIYDLQAVKYSTASNPVVLTVIPKAVIDNVECMAGCLSSEFTITGSGFGEMPAGTFSDANVSKRGSLMDVNSWTDTQITGQIPSVGCYEGNPVTIRTLYDIDSK